jgi:hypothetical protein
LLACTNTTARRFSGGPRTFLIRNSAVNVVQSRKPDHEIGSKKHNTTHSALSLGRFAQNVKLIAPVENDPISLVFAWTNI